MTRVIRSEYMHWAKNQPPARFNLASSEVDHFRLDRFPISIEQLELDGASRYRYPPLRRAIADKHGVAPEQVVMADGTSMANFIALAALVAPGDDVLVEQPAYEPMLAAARFLGAEPRFFERRPDEAFRLDPKAVESALTPGTKLVVLTNLHNPSSAFADEVVLRRIGELAPRVLVDEVYLDAARGARSAVHLGPQFVCTGSLTKVYGLSGLRCGWVLAEPALAERMWRLNDLFGVAQAHADERLSCLALARLDEIAAGTAERLERNRALANGFFAGRDELDCAPLACGLVAFPRLSRGSVDALRALLRDKYDTSIVPGRWFGMPQHFRVGLGGATDAIEGGLEQLGAALDELA